MPVILEGLCTPCKSNRCREHNPKILKRDKVTGIEMEARCICDKHVVKNTNHDETLEVEN